MTTNTTVSRVRRRDARAIVTAGVAFFSLCLAWMSVLPLFAGPDEPANFIKSAAVVRGELVGTPIDASATTSFWSTYVDIDAKFGTAQQVPWCFVGQPQTPACDKPLAELTAVEEPHRHGPLSSNRILARRNRHSFRTERPRRSCSPNNSSSDVLCPTRGCSRSAAKTTTVNRAVAHRCLARRVLPLVRIESERIRDHGLHRRVGRYVGRHL